MKHLSSRLAALICCMFTICHADAKQIEFGSDLNPATVMKEAAKTAAKAEIRCLKTMDNGHDLLCSYHFDEMDEDMPFRVCFPRNWNGKDKLPVVMFLHGGWNDESSYLDQNDRQLVRLAQDNGYLLVSPLGAHAAYGNNMILPATFGRTKELNKVLSNLKPERLAAQRLSEKDVINVLEIVLHKYPTDRRHLFLSGHSMGAGGTWYLGAKYHQYWKALAPMSGPFVMAEGYPWNNLNKIPVFITEGLGAPASLQPSRDLRDWLKANRPEWPFTYKEYEGDHGGMVPNALPDVFRFFNRQRHDTKRIAEEDMGGYLMVYFLEHGHNVYFATSEDGYTFTDINGGNPVMTGDTMALQHGIRDPHLYRGPDNAFYLAMTDLHIYAKEEGYRTTQWEREGFGWGNNRALVLMKSRDLIHWTKTNLRVDLQFPGLEDIGCTWAPATIYDEEEGKLLITFTMRHGAGNNYLYYSYVNDDFNMLLSKPKKLFDYPTDKSCIDSDITFNQGKYHLYYVAHDGTGGVKHAVSEHASGGYVYEPDWCDPETGACEAPTMWKRIGEEKYVLMYDVFSARPNNMGFSETTDFKHYTDLGHFNRKDMKTIDFSSPKHGAVVQITKKELKALRKHYQK